LPVTSAAKHDKPQARVTVHH